MAKKARTPTFEEALQELEEITRALESGGLTLDDSIKAYEKGMELRKFCLEKLNHAEKKLEYLAGDENGNLERRPVETDDPEKENQSGLFAGD